MKKLGNSCKSKEKIFKMLKGDLQLWNLHHLLSLIENEVIPSALTSAESKVLEMTILSILELCKKVQRIGRQNLLEIGLLCQWIQLKRINKVMDKQVWIQIILFIQVRKSKLNNQRFRNLNFSQSRLHSYSHNQV